VAEGSGAPQDPAQHAARPTRGRPLRSERRLLLGVLLVLALVLPFGAWLVDRAGRTGPSARPSGTSAADTGVTVQTYAAGTPAPPLDLTPLDGGTLDLASYRGRPVLLNFWATWCAPCVREFPLLRRTLDRHRAGGLVVLGVLVDDTPARARRFAREHGGDWPVGVDQRGGAVGAFKLIGLPETVFVRPDGTLASRVLGELTQARLDAQLAPILGR